MHSHSLPALPALLRGSQSGGPQTYFDLRVGFLVLLTGGTREPTMRRAFTHVAEAKSPLRRWTQAGITKNNNDDITHTILHICNYRRPPWRWEILSKSCCEHDASWCLCTRLGRRSQAPSSAPHCLLCGDGVMGSLRLWTQCATLVSMQPSQLKLPPPSSPLHLVSNSYANYLKQFL